MLPLEKARRSYRKCDHPKTKLLHEWLLSTSLGVEELSRWTLPEFLALKIMAYNKRVVNLSHWVLRWFCYTAIANQSSNSVFVIKQISLYFPKRLYEMIFMASSCFLNSTTCPLFTWDHSPSSSNGSNGFCLALNRACSLLDTKESIMKDLGLQHWGTEAQQRPGSWIICTVKGGNGHLEPH